MSEKEIFQKLKTIVVDQLGVNEENVTMEATFVDDLAADSLDIVELIMNIEEEFDLEIPDNDTEKIVTIGDVVKYIEEHKLQNCFKLLGFKNNPYPYIKKSDAFICSSRSEGFSTVATEALILNKPIFTTDCSGMRELFGNFQCGQIVLNDDQELFKLMEKLVDQQYNLRYFEEQAKECAKRFKLRMRMKEVESVLGGK